MQEELEALNNSGFHSIGVPSEWGSKEYRAVYTVPVYSFHSIGVPSEWGQWVKFLELYSASKVSIQLVSPASGDFSIRSKDLLLENVVFPFNWCPQRVGTQGTKRITVLVYVFPFNWCPQRVGTLMAPQWPTVKVVFPFNWCPQRVGTGDAPDSQGCKALHPVSIQLVSPASGDGNTRSTLPPLAPKVSIQLVSPASGDESIEGTRYPHTTLFPFNWCPQRVGTTLLPN